jgi:hypothetical protein
MPDIKGFCRPTRRRAFQPDAAERSPIGGDQRRRS